MTRADLLRSWIKPLAEKALPMGDEMDGRDILITGGTGFVGSWVVSLLLGLRELGVDVRPLVLARRPESIRARLDGLDTSSVKTISVDLTDPAALFPHAELVIHAAGDVSTGNTEAMERALVDGTRLVADLAGRSGTKKFLFVSSGAVYGPSKEGRPFKEDHQGAPDPCGPDLYGNGKRWGEALSVLRGRWGMKVSIARCFAFSGAFLPLNGRFALGDFLSDGLVGKPIKVKGTGKPLRSYMDGGDMALWLLKILLDGRAGRPYNVGSTDGRPIGEVASVVADLCGSRVEIEGGPDGRGDYVPCVERAATELGLECTVSFEESLRRMVIWNGGGLDESERLDSFLPGG